MYNILPSADGVWAPVTVLGQESLYAQQAPKEIVQDQFLSMGSCPQSAGLTGSTHFTQPGFFFHV